VRVIYCPGVFDLLHQGHLNMLTGSKALGDRLIVGVVSDAGAAAYKRLPVQDEGTRLAVIRALRVVDWAVIQPTTDPTPVLELLRPDVLTHGSDWDQLREGQETLARLGIEFAILPYTPGISSSDLVAALVDRGRAVT
jgi:rfaE bifunctional protein nucleotidyltransferase chain/domain